MEARRAHNPKAGGSSPSPAIKDVPHRGASFFIEIGDIFPSDNCLIMRRSCNLKTSFTNKEFSELYQKYGPMVLRRCRAILKDEEKALDAMQDVFLRLFEKQEQIKNACASLFYVAATRVCLNKIKADKLRSGPDFETISKIMADDFSDIEREKIEASAIIEKIFEKRDRKDSLIATLHFVDGLTLEETAEQIGMSVSGVRKRIRELQKYSLKITGGLA